MRYAYDDVRVNLLCLALTVLWRRPLGDVLRERVLDPMGASSSRAWHGYRNAQARSENPGTTGTPCRDTSG